MERGIKHLVKCRCILPQFTSQPDPPTHQFVVFSVLDVETDTLKLKLVQCNNCGIVHKITDLCTSEVIHGKESLASCVSLEEIKQSVPEQLATILETHDADLPTWEHAQWVFENQRWGEYVVLTSDFVDGIRQGKILRIIGERLFKIDTFTREEIFSLDSRKP